MSSASPGQGDRCLTDYSGLWIALLSTFSIALISIACNPDVRGPLQPTAVTAVALEGSPAAILAHPIRGRGIQDRFLETQRRIPGFGGFYLGEDGALVASLTNLSRAEAVRSEVLSNYLTSERRRVFWGASGAVRIVEGDYSISELIAWDEALRSLLSPSGVVEVGASVARNRVVVGVLDLGIIPDVEAFAQAHDIPLAALEFESSRPRLLSSAPVDDKLDDKIRPAGAGVKIQRQGDGFCTMGFNVYDVTGARYFLTASHCTGNYEGPTGVIFHQPAASNAIGSESLNPEWDGTGCGATYCRDTDVALIEYDDPSDAFNGVFYTFPIGEEADTGGSYINSYTIPVEGDTMIENQVVTKTGWRTGTTKGPVDFTCTGFVAGSQGVPCAMRAQLRSDEGDSGAPVFNQGMNFSAAAGILIGGCDSIGCGQYYTYFSRWDLIEPELGRDLRFTPVLSVDITGPSEVQENDECAWYADVEGGQSPYTYAWIIDGDTVGTDRLYSGDTGESDFELGVIIRDGYDESVWNILEVFISEQANPCPPR